MSHHSASINCILCDNRCNFISKMSYEIVTYSIVANEMTVDVKQVGKVSKIHGKYVQCGLECLCLAGIEYTSP